MTQTWRDLLFAHWPVPAAALQAHMPVSLEPDTHSGSAWIGVVPFRMTQIRPLGLPVMPIVSETLELNVRTYTTVGGVPGVFFFSLDAASKLAVRVARRFFHLPYFDAAMSCTKNDDQFEYRSRRLSDSLEFAADYAPIGPVFESLPNSLEEFLTERYALYAVDGGGALYRGRIRHPRWPLQLARANISKNSLMKALGLQVTGSPLLHFSRELRVSIEKLDRC